MRSTILLAQALALAAPLPAAAHHSIAAVYDRSREVTVEGRLTRVELINPHSRLHLEGRGPDGVVRDWMLESRAAAGMERAGFTRETAARGETVKATGFPARDGEPSLWLQSLTTESGERFSFVRR